MGAIFRAHRRPNHENFCMGTVLHCMIVMLFGAPVKKIRARRGLGMKRIARLRWVADERQHWEPTDVWVDTGRY